MQTSWPILVGLLLSSAPAPDAPNVQPPVLRAVSAHVRMLIDDTTARSATLRALLARLWCTDAIVYVEITSARDIPLARTKLVVSAPGARFIRIGINVGVPDFDMGPLLGHELQHAVEIAEHGEVRDQAGVRQLYQSIGRGVGGDQFETEAARHVEATVRTELHHRIGG